MKLVPLSEAQAHLNKYGELCKDESVVVTVKGQPAFEIVPIDDDCGLFVRLLEKNPEFRAEMEARVRRVKHEKKYTSKEALRELEKRRKQKSKGGLLTRRIA